MSTPKHTYYVAYYHFNEMVNDMVWSFCRDGKNRYITFRTTRQAHQYCLDLQSKYHFEEFRIYQDHHFLTDLWVRSVDSDGALIRNPLLA